MFFVTQEPKLFNVETGVVTFIRSVNGEEWAVTISTGLDLFIGIRQECEDFIYSMAGWVGAVNPMAKAGA
jgi:hypothetical protein